MSRAPGPGARGAGRLAAQTPERELSPGLRLWQPGAAAPSFQLRWGAKFTLKPRRRAKGALCTPLCLQPGAPQLPPRTVEARREGARRQEAAPALSRSPEPTRAGVAQRRSRAGLRRQEAGQSRPPAPSPGPPASRPRGPRTPSPRRASPYLETQSRRRVRACVRVGERAGECASRVRYMPLRGGGGKP